MKKQTRKTKTQKPEAACRRKHTLAQLVDAARKEGFAVKVGMQPDKFTHFFMVFVDGAAAPTKRHDSVAEAMQEAQRLALKEQKRAYVMSAEMECSPIPQEVTWATGTQPNVAPAADREPKLETPTPCLLEYQKPNHGGTYICTLPNGHPGQHEAHGSDPLVTWPRDELMPPCGRLCNPNDFTEWSCDDLQGKWCCTLKKGHAGDHVACSDEEHGLATWPNEAKGKAADPRCPAVWYPTLQRCIGVPGHAGNHVAEDGTRFTTHS